MKSMTGYGRARKDVNNREYIIEIKSVNHKYNDVQIKLPRVLSYLEDKIKKKVQNNISRGKVDVYISFENNTAEGKNILINTELAKVYVEQLKSLAEETGINSNIEVMELTRLPDVLNLKSDDQEADLIWEELESCLEECLKSFVTMRIIEGTKIKEDLLNRINKVEEYKNEISKYSETIVEDYVERLNNRIKEILKTDVVDQTRLAQEVVIYSDKCSVEEELTRLNSHLYQFRELIEKNEAIGKKLDFLIQEMNRETNTIGSKSGKLEITNLVIEIKTQLEDIREQIQNIE